MNKSIARILALGIAVALPTGLIAQTTTTTTTKATDKPAATATVIPAAMNARRWFLAT